MRILFPFLLMPFVLAGCSAISSLGGASRPLEIYELRALAAQPTATGRLDVEVVIEEPVTSGALATERIMIRPGPLQAQYLPAVRWADPAPVMLQTMMLRSLAGTGALGSVGRRPVGAAGDFAVLSELTDFQAESTQGTSGARVVIRLMVRLARERDAQVVASRTFSVTEGATSTDPGAIAAAFDRASARLLSDIVQWIVLRVSAAA